jgi:hypothetical protein
MTRDQQLEAVRAACIRANPEITELKFGCEVLRRSETTYHVINPLGWGANDRKCWLNSVPFGDMPIELEKDLVQNGGEFEIVGRAIRLADVLLAIGKDGRVEYAMAAHDGLQIRVGYDAVYWNLRKDDLAEQSDECVAHLAHLLG